MNNDFNNLAWHDSKVYSIIFPDIDNDLKIDIDFIIEWVKNTDIGGYKFLVAPATMRFENISNLVIKIEMSDFSELFIDEIQRVNERMSPNGKVLLWDFNVVLNAGEIAFTSTGFVQEFTDIPQLGEGQRYDRK